MEHKINLLLTRLLTYLKINRFQKANEKNILFFNNKIKN